MKSPIKRGNSSPLVWRRLLVPSDSTVAELHQALQVAFGGDDEYLNRFETRGREYALHRDGGGWHANYHPDGAQMFFPAERKPFVVPLALPEDDVKPGDFVTLASACMSIPAFGTSPLPYAGRSNFEDKQEAIHARVSCDFVKKFGVYLQVPLQMTR